VLLWLCLVLRAGRPEIVAMSLVVRISVAVALLLAIAAAHSQSASAASAKHHHPAKTVKTPKPSAQYLRSASPDPEHAQR
jgi:hypothetical protein